MNLSILVPASHVALEPHNTITNQSRLFNISREEHFKRAVENTVEFQTARFIQTYIPPLLVVFGTIGNTVTLVLIHCVQRSRKHSVLTYMFAMMVGNILSLDLGYGLSWLSYNAGLTHIANQFDATCRIWQFAINVISHVSGWIMTSLLIDRILTVHRASSAHLFTTVFVAKLVVVFICVGLTVISLHAMWIYELPENSHQCVVDQHRRDVETVVWPWVSAVVCSYLPNVIVVALTTMLVVLKSRSTSASNTEDRLSSIVIRLCVHYLLSCLPLVVLNLVMYVETDPLQSVKVYSRFILSDTVLTILSNSFYGSAFISALLTLACFKTDSSKKTGRCDCFCCDCYLNDSPKKKTMQKKGVMWGMECTQQKQLLEATSSNKSRIENGDVAGQTETVL